MGDRGVLKIAVVLLILVLFASMSVSAISRNRFNNFGDFSFTQVVDNYNITLINYSQKLGLYYKFDNDSAFGENATFIYDFSGNNRHATAYGDVINTSLSKYNFSASLDNVNRNVTLSDYIIPDGTSYTINFWFRRIGWGPSNWQIMVGEAGTNTNFIGFTSAGVFRFDHSNNTLPTSYILPDQTWVMVTVSCFDSPAINTAKFYINGTLLGYTDSGVCRGYKINRLDTSFTNLRAIGNIDELAVWEVNLEDSQIQEIYENTFPKFESRGNYSQIFTSFNQDQNVSEDTLVRWKASLYGNSSINVWACVGENYSECVLQENEQKIKLSNNSSNVKIIAELMADENNHSNLPLLEMLEPPKISVYVENSSSSCTDSNTLFRAMNSSNPFCTISAASSVIESDSEMVIIGNNYCEGISISKHGTKDYPIVVRGENLNNKTFLNGTCATPINGIRINNFNYINFYNFEIYNFSNDAANVDGTSTDINFHNLLAINNGYSQSSGSGDCVSFHVNASSSHSSNITCIGNYKSAVVDIQNSRTNYSNIYGENNRLYGVFFYGTGGGEGSTPNDIAYHEVTNLTILNSPGCYWSEVSSKAEQVNCNNITDKAIYLANKNHSVRNFNISMTQGTSLKVLNAGENLINLTDGYLDKNISIINSSNVMLVNVSYDEDLLLVDNNSTLKIFWYLTLGADQTGVNISVKNSSDLIVYSEITSDENLVFNPQIFLGKINQGGEETTEALTITASKSGYVSEEVTITLEDNSAIEFSLTEVNINDASSGSTSSSGGFVNFKVSEDNLKKGFSKILRNAWALNFTVLNQTHSITLKRVKNNSAELILFSDPKYFDLLLNETKKFDFNLDGFYDLEVKLVKLNPFLSAEIYIREIDEMYSIEQEIIFDEEKEKTNQSEKAANKIFLFLIILLALILIVTYYFKKKKVK